MLGLWLLKLAGFTLLSTLLMLVVTVAARRQALLLRWPTLYWWLLFLASVPLWPLWQWPIGLQLPQVFWFDSAGALGLLTNIGQAPRELTWQLSDLLFPGVLAVLVLGACWHCIRLVVQVRQLQRLYRQSQPVPRAALFSNNDPSDPQLEPDPRLTMIEIRRHDLALSPFIFGGRQAVLMLPGYYWQFNNQQRALLLAHELCHWQRRDPWQLFGWRLVVALGWFNPALRYFERLFSKAMELTVDREVLAAQPEQALLYGQTLLRSLKLSMANANPVGASFIQANPNHTDYSQRMTALFQTHPSQQALRRMIAVLVVSLAVLLNLGCSALQVHKGPSGQWQLPVIQGRVNAAFGTINAIRGNRPHRGIDFYGKTGDPVLASADGLVVVADHTSLNPRLGNTVLIEHGDGYQTLYAHLDSFTVHAGLRITAGQQIGAVGATGVATGPHLHFELLHQGMPLDPTALLHWQPKK